MHFCPHCGNMLQLEVPLRFICAPATASPHFFSLVPSQNLHCVSFFCQTCPYVHRIEKKVWRCLLEAAMGMFFISTSLQAQIELDILISRKGVDDVLGGAEAWKNADQADGASARRCVPDVPPRH